MDEKNKYFAQKTNSVNDWLIEKSFIIKIKSLFKSEISLTLHKFENKFSYFS